MSISAGDLQKLVCARRRGYISPPSLPIILLMTTSPPVRPSKTLYLLRYVLRPGKMAKKDRGPSYVCPASRHQKRLLHTLFLLLFTECDAPPILYKLDLRCSGSSRIPKHLYFMYEWRDGYIYFPILHSPSPSSLYHHATS
jgi:hypothetical protein